MLGAPVGDLATRVAAGMNAVYKILTGSAEDPRKARIDMEAASVVADYVTGNASMVELQLDASRCAGREGYVLSS